MTDAPPALILTRPRPQSERFAAELAEALGPVPVVVSPILAIRDRTAAVDLAEVGAVILSSENGARALARQADVAGITAFCVGRATAEAARARGMRAYSADGAAAELVAAIRAAAPVGRLLHARGAESRGEVAERLRAAGIEVVSQVLYEQVPLALTPEAEALLAGPAPVLLPLFSPRSAALAGMAAAGAVAPIRIAALSPAVAEGWTGPAPERVAVAKRPDAAAMIEAIASICRCDLP